MIKQLLSRSILGTSAVMALGMLMAPPVGAETAGAQVMRQEVQTHPAQGEVKTVDGAEAMLTTTEEGAFAAMSTKELNPGHAYTMWFVAINDPEACETSPCKSSDVLKRTKEVQADVGYGDGLIAGPDGSGEFAAFVPAGALTQAWFDHGLKDPRSAEIHLALHDHGPLMPDMAGTMLGSYRGGCTEESLPDAVPASARADGEAGSNACIMAQFAIFQQGDMQSAAAQ